MDKKAKIGGFSALYMAVAYLIGITIFLFVLNYPSITEPSDKIKLLESSSGVIIITNLIMYIFFGFVLIAFVLTVRDLLKEKCKFVADISAIIGIIWGGLLIASGMVSNAGIKPALEIFSSNPELGANFWLGIEAVANGLGGANGEILGGIMTLLISMASIKSGIFNKAINILGIVTGIFGILSLIPLLVDLTGLFGITQMLWFIFVGIKLLKNQG